jgi:hypothetical protein
VQVCNLHIRQKNSVFPFEKVSHKRAMQGGNLLENGLISQKNCVKRNPQSTHGRASQLCNQRGRQAFSGTDFKNAPHKRAWPFRK